MKEKKKGETLVAAGLFIGIGIGLATKQVAAGTLIGLGVGIAAAFIYSAIYKGGK